MSSEWDVEGSPEEITQEHIDGLIYHIETGMMGRSNLEHLKNAITKKFNEQTRDPNKPYLSEDQGIVAYGRVLEDDSTALQALEYVAQYYGKDQAWVDEVKKNNYIHARKVSKAYDEHPIQVSMIEDGTFTKDNRKGNTPSQHLTRLHTSKKLHNKLNDLSKANDTLEVKVEGLEAQVSVNESKLDDTRLSLGLNPLTDKEKAGILKGKNFTQKFIAEHLGVSLSTVKRWWDSL